MKSTESILHGSCSTISFDLTIRPTYFYRQVLTLWLDMIISLEENVLKNFKASIWWLFLIINFYLIIDQGS